MTYLRKSCGIKFIAALVGGAALVVSGCTTTSGPSGLYAAPIGNSPVVSNPTPYSTALFCLADWARASGRPSPRIAVGRISDYTGQVGSNGRIITQGASLMAMTALGKAGAAQVERFDTSVSEMEMRYASAQLIGDGAASVNGAPAQPRRLIAGSVPGSDFVVQGGITEANFNIRGSGLQVGGSDGDDSPPRGGLFNARSAVMNVAIDLRVVDTRTQEIVDVISYQKQLIGREVALGWFDFLNGNVFDLSVGTGGQEPVQFAVRALVERAIVEIMANMYGAPGPEACLQVSGDPLFNGTTGPTGSYYPAYDNVGQNNGDTRADPSRWHDRRDPAVRRSRY